MINLREYRSEDELAVALLLNGLQDYLVKIDPLNNLRRLENYGIVNLQKLTNKIKLQNGRLFIAEDGDNVIGFIAGVIEDQPPDELLGCAPLKTGRIVELFISENYRNQNVGQSLMQLMENYFELVHCDLIRVEVFTPNTNAINFYQCLGYGSRVIDMVKKIK